MALTSKLPALRAIALAEELRDRLEAHRVPRLDADPDVRRAAMQADRQGARRVARGLAGTNDPVDARRSFTSTNLARDGIAREHWPRDRRVRPTELRRARVRRGSGDLEAIAHAARRTRGDDVPRALAGPRAPCPSAGVRDVRDAGGFDASVAAPEEPVGAVGARKIQTARLALTVGGGGPKPSFVQPPRKTATLAPGRGEPDDEQRSSPARSKAERHCPTG